MAAAEGSIEWHIARARGKSHFKKYKADSCFLVGRDAEWEEHRTECGGCKVRVHRVAILSMMTRARLHVESIEIPVFFESSEDLNGPDLKLLDPELLVDMDTLSRDLNSAQGQHVDPELADTQPIN